MKVLESQANDSTHEFKIVVSKNIIEQKTNERLKVLGSKARFDGFRPGKAPVALLEKQYGAKARQEAHEAIINDNLKALIKEHKLETITQPIFEIIKNEPESDFEYKLTVELAPKITPIKVEDLALDYYELEVADEDVQKMMADYVAEHPRGTELKKPRPVKNGDILTIDFLGKLDGVPFKGGEAKGASLIVGKGQFIPGFEEQIIGAEQGELRVISVTFPADYHAKDLAGKETTFDIMVHTIQEPKAFQQNDEDAVEYGFKSYADMLETFKNNIRKARSQMSDAFNKRILLDKLEETHEFAVPPSLVEREFQTIWRTAKNNPDHVHSESCNHEDEDDNLTEEEYKDIAKRRVRLGLLLAEIGKLHKVKVSRNDVEMAVYREAMRYDNPRKAYDFIIKNNAMMAAIQAPLFEDAVERFIFEKAKVTRHTISEKDLEKKMEAYEAAVSKDAKPAKEKKKK